MKQKNLQLQRGFLLVVAVILIATVAVIGLILDYMFIGKTTATTNVMTSDQAFYIATSGNEIAKRDMIARNQSCSFINTRYGTPRTLFGGHAVSSKVNGEFTVNCFAMPTGTLPQTITSTATNILLPAGMTNALPSFGAIVIDSEIIGYSGISGNYIINATRGSSGTSATGHSVGAPINNNSYILISTGAVPSIANARGKRKIRQELFFGTSGSNLFNIPGGYTPAFTVGTGTSSLHGSASITNNSCNGSPACSFLTGGNIDFNGSFATNNGTACGGTHCVPGPDVVENYSGISTADFFSYFFGNKTIADFNATSVPGISSLNQNSSGSYIINGDVRMTGSNTYFTTSTPSVLIINGNLTIESSTTIGSTNGPILLLVMGNLIIKGSTTVVGFVYSDSNLDISGSTAVNGAVASKGARVEFTGSAAINFNTSLLRQLGFGGGATVVSSPEVY